MPEQTSLARLLSSAVHDLRNVLALVRESSGLTGDLVRIQENIAKKDRMLDAVATIQSQVLKGALLADAMDLLAQAGSGNDSGSCAVNHVCSLFCCMAQRMARASRIRLEHAQNQDLEASLPPQQVLDLLVQVMDICTKAGGNVDLKLGADYRQKSVGILVEVVAGDNEQAVALALSQSPLLNEVTRGIKNLLTPWRKAQKLYFLPLSGTGEA